MWLLYIVILVLSAYYLYSKYYNKKSKTPKPQVVPGLSKTSQTLGNLEDIANAGSMVDFLKNLHIKFGPIASFWYKDVYTVSLGDKKYYKLTEKMFDRHEVLFEFAEPLISKKSSQFLNGEFGRGRYRLMSEPFGYSGCSLVFDQMKLIVKDFIKDWRVGDQINLHETMMRLAINIILKTNFGYYFEKVENSERLLTLYFNVIDDLEDVLNGLWSFDCGDEREKLFQENLSEFKDAMKTIVDEHKNRKHNGDYDRAPFLDILLENIDDEDEIIHQSITMMTGGFHTTGAFMTWFFYNVGLHTEIQNNVRAEIAEKFSSGLESIEDMKRLDYSRSVMDETLRHSKIGLFSERKVEKDLEIDGFNIPEGTQLLNAICLTLDDKNSFKNPGAFDPENIRLSKKAGLAFSPFGFGVRKCPGYRFADVEMTLVALEILSKFKIEIDPKDRDVKPTYGFVTKPSKEISIKLRAI